MPKAPGRMLAVLVAAVSSSAIAVTADWPEWRGPERTGRSPARGLPMRWSATENVAWRLPLPSGSGSTAIVGGDRVFLNVADGPEVALWCVDRATGRVSWKGPLGPSEGHAHRKHNMSSPSPVVGEGRVFAMTGNGVVKGFTVEGRELWARDLQGDYGKFGLQWGYGSSPLLEGDVLYIQVLHGSHTSEPSYLLGLDPTTGKTRFRVERRTGATRESPDAYTTPAVARRDGKTEIVVTGADVVTGHDPATGRELWRASGLNPDNEGNYRIVASPVAVGDLVVAPTRVRPMLALRAFGRGDVSGTHRVWAFDRGPDVPTPASDGKHLYVVTDKGVLWCLDLLTGEPIYGPERLAVGTYSASPLLADGKVYVTNEDGLTTVVKAGPAFERLAENPLDGFTLSSPAAAGGQLYLRTSGALYAIGSRPGP
ncbi:MAG TPA: PQQ-binding-like beta-propeller repeat protein [Vicinamibacteria bacterium]|nr:PQQ-binding-like beta-propeller repeat protein [Vicinamibacteria bacterium]